MLRVSHSSLLASVVAQFDRRLPRDEPGEQSAGCDLGELLRVTDEHDLGAACGRTSSRIAARSRVPAVPASSMTSTVRSSSPPGSLLSIAMRSRAIVVDGMPAALVSLVGGDAGVGGADHPVAGSFPRLACGREGEGLAGSGGCGEDVDAVAGCSHAGSPPIAVLRTGSARLGARRADPRRRTRPRRHRGVVARGRAHGVRC